MRHEDRGSRRIWTPTRGRSSTPRAAGTSRTRWRARVSAGASRSSWRPGIALAVGPGVVGVRRRVLKMTAAVVAVGAVVGAGVYVVSARDLASPRRCARMRAHVARARRRSRRRRPPSSTSRRPPWRTPPRAHSQAPRPVAAPAPVAVENVSGLKEETALLGAANAALARGDVKRALSLLDDYDRRPGVGDAVAGAHRDRHPRLLRRRPRRCGARGSTALPRALAAVAARRRASTARAPGPPSPRARSLITGRPRMRGCRPI